MISFFLSVFTENKAVCCINLQEAEKTFVSFDIQDDFLLCLSGQKVT